MSEKINKLENAIHGVQTDLDKQNREEYFGTRDIPQSTRNRSHGENEFGDYWEE